MMIRDENKAHAKKTKKGRENVNDKNNLHS